MDGRIGMARLGGEAMNMKQLERLRFIDFVLDYYGEIHREVIAEYFGMSIVQATLDIKAYIGFVPDNIKYCKTKRRYVRAEKFERKYP